jgi:hypothetical protein
MQEEILFSNGGPSTEDIRTALVRTAEQGVAGMNGSLDDHGTYYKGRWKHRFALRFHHVDAHDSEHKVLDINISAQEDSGERNTALLCPQQKYSVIRLELDVLKTDLEPPFLKRILESVLEGFSHQLTVVDARIVLRDIAV